MTAPKIDYGTVEALAAAARLSGVTIQRWNRKRVHITIGDAHRLLVRKRVVFALFDRALQLDRYDRLHNLYGTMRWALERHGIFFSAHITSALVRGFQGWVRSQR